MTGLEWLLGITIVRYALVALCFWLMYKVVYNVYMAGVYLENDEDKLGKKTLKKAAKYGLLLVVFGAVAVGPMATHAPKRDLSNTIEANPLGLGEVHVSPVTSLEPKKESLEDKKKVLDNRDKEVYKELEDYLSGKEEK